VSGQEVITDSKPAAAQDKKSPASPSPSPAVKPTPAPPPAPSFMEQPDYKAYMAGVREKDPHKKIALLEKFLVDFPDSHLDSQVQEQLFQAVIKAAPTDKERIYGQALKAIGAIQTENPYMLVTQVANTYNSVINSLFKVGMNDRALEIAEKGVVTIDTMTAQQMFRSKSPMWVTLGQIYLKNGDIKKAEQYFKQAISGDYEGNRALVGLAEIAENRRKPKQQLDYLIQADAKGILKIDQRAKLEELYAKRHGSTAGLRDMLDANYKRLNPLPITVVKYSPTPKRTNRTVLAELFTGAACRPCITADTAFEALLVRYNPSDVTVLIYDLHIPGPDPITNPAAIARAKFYGATTTPTYIVNGTDKQTGGGVNRKEAGVFLAKLTPKIDSHLERESEAELRLSASMENGIVKTNADFANVKGDYSGLKLHITLVEHEISYMGENGVRFHPMVVREIGGENRSGFDLKDKSGRIAWKFDVAKVTADLKSYLDKYETDQRKEDKDFAFTEKKHQLNGKNLAVVAFIQDEKTKTVLQSAFIDLAETKK
jgi:tetratricopeptide (TPR) repeat protein